MHYFSGFPTTLYDLPVAKSSGLGSARRSKTQQLFVTDITKRLLIKEISGAGHLVYYEYEVKDGERPDVIAEKYYGDSRLDWLIFMYNQITDPYFQWPLSIRDFEKYIRQKYGSIPNAQATVNRYEKLIYAESKFTNDFGETLNIPARYVTVDKSTYDALSATSRREIDAYTHEDNLNEARRNIKLLDEGFVTGMIEEYKEMFF